MDGVGDIIRLNALSMPHQTALISDQGVFTYLELNLEINRVASALQNAGVGVGDRIAVLSRNCAEYVELYYAVAKIGALLVPLNFWHRAGEHSYVLENSDP